MWLDNESRRERYIRLLSTKMRELQRKPTFAEMRADPMMPSPNDYAFYWGSFDEAVEEIWLKVRRQIAEEGGVCMAKTPKKWPHTADELLELAVAKCVEMGRMPSRRAWLRDQFLDYEEIVAVLGKGDWKRAELKIALAWDHRKGKAEEVVVEKVELPKNEPPGEEPSQEEIVVQQEVKEQIEIKHRRKRYSLEELKAGMTRVQEHFQITDMPTQVQISQAAREIGTPSYATFLHGLGPKRGWNEVLNPSDD